MNNARSSFLPINQDRLFKKTEAKLEKQGPTEPRMRHHLLYNLCDQSVIFCHAAE